MSANASLNAQAVASDGGNWTLTIGRDGATALFRTGEKLAELDPASAVGILTAEVDATQRIELLLDRLEQSSGAIDQLARRILLNSASWIEAHWD